jgi:hypothetical protein
VYNPPPPLQEWMTGLHLRFDDFALAWAKYRAAQETNAVDWLSLPSASPHMAQQREALRRNLEKIVGEPGLIDGWGRRCQEMGYGEGSYPVVIWVDISPKAFDSVRREAQGSFESFPIRYRPAGPADPHIGAGDGIGRAGSTGGGGTLGGFLEDGITGDLYGVTCEHVAGARGTIADGLQAPRSRIGVVSHAQRSTAGSPCNRHAKPNAGTFDAALVKIDRSLTVTNIPSVTVAALTSVDQDDHVMFRGWKSGLVNTIKVTATTVWKTINFGSPVCFADLFMLDFRRPTYVVSAVSQGGDSGSWIIEDPTAPPTVAAWYGMLMAGDRQQSFACYGEHVLDWAKAQHAPLRLP